MRGICLQLLDCSFVLPLNTNQPIGDARIVSKQFLKQRQTLILLKGLLWREGGRDPAESEVTLRSLATMIKFSPYRD